MNQEENIYQYPQNIKINNSDYDSYTSYITYLNNQIALHQNNKNSKKDADTVNRLKHDRDMLLQTLNKMYDNNTNTLDIKFKLDTNDDYIQSVQEQQILENNEKMQKTRLHEMKEYEIELKNHSIRYLFWSMIALSVLIAILLLNTYAKPIFGNNISIFISLSVFIAYIIYIIADVSQNYNRSKRFYSKFDFDTPAYVHDEGDISALDEDGSCADGYVDR